MTLIFEISVIVICFGAKWDGFKSPNLDLRVVDFDTMKQIFCAIMSEALIPQGFLDIEKERKMQYHWYHNFRSYVVEPRGMDLIKVSIPSSRNRATVHRTVASNLFDSPLRILYQIIKPPRRVVLFFGGAEGNRTPVRKQLGGTFSGRSLLFTFPRPHGNKHPYGLSSFIMHGMRKALHTHVLYSDHTRARLVDLPGRMGA